MWEKVGLTPVREKMLKIIIIWLAFTQILDVVFTEHLLRDYKYVESSRIVRNILDTGGYWFLLLLKLLPVYVLWRWAGDIAYNHHKYQIGILGVVATLFTILNIYQVIEILK